jgi:hypothetical protein
MKRKDFLALRSMKPDKKFGKPSFDSLLLILFFTRLAPN